VFAYLPSFALEHPESDERIEEVAGTARVKAEALRQLPRGAAARRRAR
jgi:hypothetical protein